MGWLSSYSPLETTWPGKAQSLSLACGQRPIQSSGGVLIKVCFTGLRVSLQTAALGLTTVFEDPGLPAFALPPVSVPGESVPLSDLSVFISSIFGKVIRLIDALVISGKGSRQNLVTRIAFSPFSCYWSS